MVGMSFTVKRHTLFLHFHFPLEMNFSPNSAFELPLESNRKKINLIVGVILNKTIPSIALHDTPYSPSCIYMQCFFCLVTSCLLDNK